MAQIKDLPSSPGVVLNPVDLMAMDRRSDDKTRKVNIARLATVTSTRIVVQSKALLTPPAHVNGHFWLLAEGTLTGDWSSKTSGDIVLSVANNWADMVAYGGLEIYDVATGTTWKHNGTIWVQTAGFGLQTVSSVSGVLTMDFTKGMELKTTLTEAVSSVVLTDPILPGKIHLEIVQDSTPRTINWTGPGTITWEGGAAPTLSAGSGAIDLVTLWWNGTTYRGHIRQAYA